MIRLVEALGFRCLRNVRQPLDSFHVLVGPNASGKTTFLDVVRFLGDVVDHGPIEAVAQRTSDFRDLVWGRHEHDIELAVEAAIPESRRNGIESGFDTIRYELALGLDQDSRDVVIRAERVLLKKWTPPPPKERTLFPGPEEPPLSIMTDPHMRGKRFVVSKGEGENDTFSSEVTEEGGKGWLPTFKLGRRRSAFGNLPEDESRFPAATWLKTTLARGVQSIVLNSLLMRQPSPPLQRGGFNPDGSNLPWVIDQLSKHPEAFRNWLAHLQTALPDVESIRTIERPEDKHKYLVICYRGGLEVPSWMASDGTLRLLALTILAYLPNFTGIYLIEEPENGIHPRAVSTVYQSLSSVYDAQILLATHSPVILGEVPAEKVLCFKKTDDGATDIVKGNEHPALRTWQGETNLSVLFASGVLG